MVTAERATDLPHRFVATRISARRTTRHNGEPADSAEPAGDFVRHPCCEVFIICPAEILEWQDRYCCACGGGRLSRRVGRAIGFAVSEPYVRDDCRKEQRDRPGYVRGPTRDTAQIGRASCRGRGEVSGAGG